MEAPVRPSRPARRAPAADRLSLAPAALLLVAALAAGACTPEPGPAPGPAAAPGGAGTGLALGDATRVAPGEEGDFPDLPGIEGFERLEPALQARVVERANLTRCDCGCPRHSVNHCLHQREACEVAIGTARGFVDDALAHQLHAAAPGAAAEEPGDDNPEPNEAAEAEPEGPGEEAAN